MSASKGKCNKQGRDHKMRMPDQWKFEHFIVDETPEVAGHVIGVVCLCTVESVH